MILRSWQDGVRRVISAPAILAGVFTVTLLTALPLAMVMRDSIETHLGRSLMANEAASAVNYDWWQEFASQTTGLGSTFTPSIIGFGSTLDNLSGVLDARGRMTPLLAAIAVYLAAWIFLSGGVIDRYARTRPTRAHGFFAVSGAFFFRFARLAIVAGLLYWCLITYVHDWIFTTLYTRATRDLSVERSAFLWRFGMYALYALLLASVNVVIDYAKIRAVVEDRRSILGALRAALGFISRHLPQVCGLYVLNIAVALGVIALWALVAPSAGSSGWSMWLAFAIAQIYLLARLVLKLQFLAAQTALFQASLAHAAYTAAPAPVWPESPAAETLASS